MSENEVQLKIKFLLLMKYGNEYGKLDKVPVRKNFSPHNHLRYVVNLQGDIQHHCSD